ncbi:MAG: DUF3644 domain-containing protein [Streptosporangiaceae bacterium]
MAWPKWRHTLNEAKRLAVRAVDEYNCSTGHYGDFIGTMVRAWLYLLQAEFQRDKIDYRYKNQDGDPILIDGEPKLWDALKSAKERFPTANDPVRINLELFIALRNKVEHRYEHALKAAAGGRAHALVINFEQELVAQFGVQHSLADQLRFPLFVESITGPERKDTIKAARALRAAQTVLAKFDADLDSEVLDDQRFDFRVRLVPMLGPKSEADAAMEFVKLDELTDDERKVMIEAGRSGRVVTKVKKVPVSSAGCMLPKRVVSEVQKRVPYDFNMGVHTRLWKHFQLHPARWVAPDGGETVSEFCIPDEPTRQYVFTPAWVDKIVKEIGTPEKFEALFGTPPRIGKVTQIEAAPSKQEHVKMADSERAVS